MLFILEIGYLSFVFNLSINAFNYLSIAWSFFMKLGLENKLLEV
jgi:hypothetical protein